MSKNNYKKNISNKNIKKKPVKKQNIKEISNKKQVIIKKKVKKRKIRFGRVFLFIVLPILIIYLVFTYVKFPIKNIYITGNNILGDQEIIELAHLETYPSIFDRSSLSIKNSLEKNRYIKKANVTKKYLSEVHIKIEESRPLFYYENKDETIFDDLKSYKGEDKKANVTLINYVPDTKYEKLLKGLLKVDSNVYSHISEIEYVPDLVNDERFVLYMNDGNLVYFTLGKINKLNKYIDIIKTLDNKKGILYLDSGEYFEIKEN